VQLELEALRQQRLQCLHDRRVAVGWVDGLGVDLEAVLVEQSGPPKIRFGPMPYAP
jgi:hypothetical protein